VSLQISELIIINKLKMEVRRVCCASQLALLAAGMGSSGTAGRIGGWRLLISGASDALHLSYPAILDTGELHLQVNTRKGRCLLTKLSSH
jgi:hypothetical protein